MPPEVKDATPLPAPGGPKKLPCCMATRLRAEFPIAICYNWPTALGRPAPSLARTLQHLRQHKRNRDHRRCPIAKPSATILARGFRRQRSETRDCLYHHGPMVVSAWRTPSFIKCQWRPPSPSPEPVPHKPAIESVTPAQKSLIGNTSPAAPASTPQAIADSSPT